MDRRYARKFDENDNYERKRQEAGRPVGGALKMDGKY
jgi:hypothetical protein